MPDRLPGIFTFIALLLFIPVFLVPLLATVIAAFSPPPPPDRLSPVEKNGGQSTQ